MASEVVKGKTKEERGRPAAGEKEGEKRLVCCAERDFGDERRQALVVVGATEVVTALGADELAAVACEAVRAVGTELGVVLDGRIGGRSGGSGGFTM